MLHSLTTSRAADQALAWLLTYAIHSTLLLAAAWAISRRLGGRWLRLQETLWRCALMGALLTASAQLAFGGLGRAPFAGRWTLVSPGAPAAPAPPTASVAAVAASSAWLPEERAALAGSRADIADRELRESRVQAEQRPRQLRRVPVAAAWTPAAEGARRSVARAWVLPLRALLLPAWILGALAFTIGTVRSYLSLRRRLRYRPQVVGGGVLARLAVLVRDSGFSRRVRLTCTWRLRVPVALGLRAAEVCVPPRALFELDDEQQDALLAHELAHLARRDPVWLPVTQLVAGVFFFQPLNWLARRRLRELSELLCDEWAVARTGRPLSLAACLAEVAGWSLAALGGLAPDTARRQAPRLPVPGMADRPSQLAHRIRRLLDGAPPDGRGPDRARLAVIAAAVLVAVTLAAPGIYAGSPAGPPALAGTGGVSTALTPLVAAAAVPMAAKAGARPAAHALMVVAALAPAADQRPAVAGAAASPVTAPAPAAAPETAAAPELAAEGERLAAAASRLEQLDKLSTLSQDQLEAIAESVERISREIDGKLGEEIEHLNHQLAAARAAGPHREDLPAAEWRSSTASWRA